jgi:hypothetical protein
MGSDAKERVKAPAIALLVVGGLYVLGGLGCCGNGILTLNMMSGSPPTMKGVSKEFQESYETGAKMGAPVHIGSGIFALIASGVMIFGALQMMKLKSYGLAMTTAVLAMLPCNPCCIAGLPIGIWALIVLMKPEIKSAFS